MMSKTRSTSAITAGVGVLIAIAAGVPSTFMRHFGKEDGMVLNPDGSLTAVDTEQNDELVRQSTLSSGDDTYGGETQSQRQQGGDKLAGTATQSSTYGSEGASKAADDDVTTMAHTTVETNPWWQLDLGSSFSITHVKVLNRPGKCASRLFNGLGCDWEYNSGSFAGAIQGADIYVSDVSCRGDRCTGHKCGKVATPKTSGDHWYEINCTWAVGQYVSLILPGSSRLLNLMEMQVYGNKAVDASWTLKTGTFCQGNWVADWEARTVKSVSECKASCAASASCHAITLMATGDDLNCVLCTSSTYGRAPWTTTYEKQAFTHYDGFCRDAEMGDVMSDYVEGVTSLSACKHKCEEDVFCTAFEFYPDTAGYLDRKCHRFPGTEIGVGGQSSKKPTQGGGSYLDAQCYIKAPCTCSNGVAVTGTECSKPNEEKCASCIGDFHLTEENLCKPGAFPKTQCMAKLLCYDSIAPEKMNNNTWKCMCLLTPGQQHQECKDYYKCIEQKHEQQTESFEEVLKAIRDLKVGEGLVDLGKTSQLIGGQALEAIEDEPGCRLPESMDIEAIECSCAAKVRKGCEAITEEQERQKCWRGVLCTHSHVCNSWQMKHCSDEERSATLLLELKVDPEFLLNSSVEESPDGTVLEETILDKRSC